MVILKERVDSLKKLNSTYTWFPIYLHSYQYEQKCNGIQQMADEEMWEMSGVLYFKLQLWERHSPSVNQVKKMCVCECQVSEWAIKVIWTTGVEMCQISKCDWNNDHIRVAAYSYELLCILRSSQQDYSQEILFPKDIMWYWKTWWSFTELSQMEYDGHWYNL